MPTPLLDLAVVGLEPWADAVVRAVGACGGVLSVPDILGTAQLAAAILRAFPRDGLLDRGTPLSVIATKDGPSARALADQLREILPDREIGFTTSDKYTESEDIVVTPYTEIFGYQAQYAGILIGDDLTAVDFLRRDRRIAPIGSAARWGIRSTAAGGAVELDMDVEGVFGPLVASIAYDDVVKAGIAVPITVVWLPCPKPKEYLGSAPLGVLAETAMPRNKAFVGIVAEILDAVPDGTGCILCTDNSNLAARVSACVPRAVEVSKDAPAKARKEILGGLAGGAIRKAIASSGCFPRKTDHGVMVVATCAGELPGWSFNWRHLKKPGEKAWLVDFRHDWDRHNGRPGRLALNDEARMRRYKDMGFAQMSVPDVARLPFC